MGSPSMATLAVRARAAAVRARAVASLAMLLAAAVMPAAAMPVAAPGSRSQRRPAACSVPPPAATPIASRRFCDWVPPPTPSLWTASHCCATRCARTTLPTARACGSCCKPLPTPTFQWTPVS